MQVMENSTKVQARFYISDVTRKKINILAAVEDIPMGEIIEKAIDLYESQSRIKAAPLIEEMSKGYEVSEGRASYSPRSQQLTSLPRSKDSKLPNLPRNTPKKKD